MKAQTHSPSEKAGSQAATRGLMHRCLVLMLFALATAVQALPADFAFSGTFTADDDQKSFFFTLSQGGNVVLRTYSYAGGTNPNGVQIPSGGFDPTLSVFDATGQLIASNQDGGCANVGMDAVTGLCLDAYLSLQLPAGTYQVVLTQSVNVPAGPTFTEAFAYTGLGNFTIGPQSTGTAGFQDGTGAQRSAAFGIGTMAVTSSQAQLIISQQTPSPGKVGTPYSYQFVATGGTQPYAWTLASGVLPAGLTLASNGLLTGMPTAFGTFNFTLQNTDSTNPAMTASQSFQLVIAAQDLQITTSALPPWVVNNAFTQNLTLVGGYPPYAWSLQGGSASVAGLTVSPAGVLSGMPTATGAVTIPVQVTDSQQNIKQAQFAWQVDPPLTITSAAALPPATSGRVYAGFTLTAQGGAAATPVWSVASGSSLPPGVTLSAAGVLQGSPSAAGLYSFAVRVTDTIQPVQQTVTLGVYDALSITTSVLPGGTVGSGYGPVTLTGHGGSGGYTWSAVRLPGGLSVSTAGVLNGFPASGGTFQSSVTLTDTTAAQSAQATLPITISWQPLQISSATNLGGAALGTGVSKGFAAAGGKLPYTWAAIGAPAGLSMDASSGILSGTASQPGAFAFTVQVTDSQPVSTSVNVTFSVLGITTNSLPGASTVAAYSQTVSAAGGTGRYSWSGSGFPTGISLSGTGTLSGTPRASGTFPMSLTVTDSAGVTAAATLALTVAAPSQLTVSPGALSSGIAGVTYGDSLAASGGTAPYVWSIIGGALPDGLTLGSAGSISGTPSTAGMFSFTARATDGGGIAATASQSITINPAPITVTSSTLPDGVVGSDYPAQILNPSGGVQPYQFAIATGTLPPGLSFAAGQIAGTPTTAGTSSFTVSVTDSAAAPKSTTTGLAITIKPAQADLILSSGSVSFSLMAPAASLPSGANVTVRSSVVLQLLNYTVSVTPVAPWLDVTSVGANTPGSLGISLNSAALALAASASSYQTSVVVSCVSPSPCAGKSQTISVSLNVTAPPPQLQLTSSLLSFSASSSNPNPTTLSLGIQNKGGGTLGIKSVSVADSWLTLSGVPGTVGAGPAADIPVGVSLTGLVPGYYRSSISVLSSAGSASVPVTLRYTRNGSLSLSPAGSQFQTQAGSPPGNPNGSLTVIPAGKPSIGWNAAVLNGSAWLKLGAASGTATLSSPGTVPFSVDSTGLGASTYYDSIRITSPDVVDSPQDFTVVLNVNPVTAPITPDPEPAGLLFLSSAGGGSVAPQTVQVFASSGAPIAYQASAGTSDGAAWLAVSPATGFTSSALPAQTMVTVTPGTLPAGVYRGSVSYALSSAAVRSVNVTLNIASAGSAAPVANTLTSLATPAPAGTGCAPATLVPTQTGLVSNFAQPTAWPTPLSIRLVDNCGSSVNSGQVVATFSNGDPPLPLRANDAASGIYTGTWTPRASASPVNIVARATATGFPAATAQITGQVSPNSAPVLTPNATLHVFAPLVGGALGPGNIVQIYGQNMSAQPTLSTTIPLPTKLGGTSVIIGGVFAPLYYASATQINAQVPFELETNKKYQIVVQANGAITTPDVIELSEVSPGIAAFAGGGIIAQHLDGTLIGDTSPAKPGEIIVFYMAGLGLTDSPISSGAGAPLDKLLRPQEGLTLTLNGANVPLLFAGLTPGLVGLYQVNFQLPDNTPDGSLPLVITQNGVKSNPTVLPVKH